MPLPILQNASKLSTDTSAVLPLVAALDELWQEVKRRPLWWPSRLWGYIKLRSEMRLRLIDPARVRIVTPKGKINDCGGCTDSCCLGGRNTVLLRLKDVAGLIDLGRVDLMTQNKPVFAAAVLKERPALARQVNSTAWRVMPVLKQKAFGACLALDDAGRCSLYPHWPLSCARFPLSLDTLSDEIFFAERCQSFWIHPAESSRASAMAVSAVASYNERIKDAILLRFARPQLAQMGLTRYLSL